MNQDSDKDRAGGQKPRRDGEQRSFGRRDDDRGREGRNRDDRPRFNRTNDESRPRFTREGDNRTDRPRFDRDNTPSDRPRFDRNRENRDDDRPRRRENNDTDRPRFNDRGGNRDDRRGDAPTRFNNQNDRFGSERRFNDRPDTRPSRPADRNDDRSERRGRDDRFNAGREERPRVDRNRDDRPRSDDRPERRTNERDERPRFDRDRPSRDADRPRFDRSRDARDRNDRSDKPAFKREGGFRRDSDERNRFQAGGTSENRSRNDRGRDDRNDRENSPYRFTPEQRKESGERRTGRYDKAPNYNLEQRPHERRDRRDDRRDSTDRFAKSNRKSEAQDRPKRSSDEHTAEPGTTRLNRYIANSGVCSRREADELIAKGDISVNGNVVTEMGFRVKEGDTVKYGTKVLNPERFVYVLLNKPKDYITTTDDPEERKTVMELVADAGNFRLYPVGRLDRKTTGLLLLTNDGELADKLTHPSNNIRKIYQVEIDKPITEEHFEALQKGIELEDGLIKPDALSIVTPDAQVIGIEIHSGRNRIVRRMFEHFGYEVTKLDRTTFAGLTKKELPRGKWRFLDPKEVVKLKYLN